jgi:hypothetical protein
VGRGEHGGLDDAVEPCRPGASARRAGAGRRPGR